MYRTLLALCFILTISLTYGNKVREDITEVNLDSHLLQDPKVEAVYIGGVGYFFCAVFSLPIWLIAVLSNASWWNCYYFPPWM